jgi:hypothetical protein
MDRANHVAAAGSREKKYQEMDSQPERHEGGDVVSRQPGSDAVSPDIVSRAQ